MQIVSGDFKKSACWLLRICQFILNFCEICLWLEIKYVDGLNVRRM